MPAFPRSPATRAFDASRVESAAALLAAQYGRPLTAALGQAHRATVEFLFLLVAALLSPLLLVPDEHWGARCVPRLADRLDRWWVRLTPPGLPPARPAAASRRAPSETAWDVLPPSDEASVATRRAAATQARALATADPAPSPVPPAAPAVSPGSDGAMDRPTPPAPVPHPPRAATGPVARATPKAVVAAGPRRPGRRRRPRRGGRRRAA